MTLDPSERQFSVLSGGDRFSVRLAAAQGPSRYLVLLTGPDGCACGGFIDAAIAAWSHFAAVAALDLPLCGTRSSDKLSAVALDRGHPLAGRLREDVARQLRTDLENALEVLSRRLELDASGIAYVGVGLGADLSGPFCDSGRLSTWVLAPYDSDLVRGVESAQMVEPPPLENPSAWLAKVGELLRSRLS
jgi:hypothetical protein